MIERCLWTETSPPAHLPDEPLPTSTDVAIIGGGYTGLSAARTLARHGAEVTVLEQHTIGWGASGRNGGFVLPGYKPEMEELDRWLGADRAAGMFQLTLDAIGYVEGLVSEEHIDCDFVRCGGGVPGSPAGSLTWARGERPIPSPTPGLRNRVTWSL
jgi:glycine/D-amino acid oxidase-like deaminating enzyme